MLYGKQYIYGGTNPFKQSGMKMGVKDFTIDEVVNINGSYYIKGRIYRIQQGYSGWRNSEHHLSGPNLLVSLKKSIRTTRRT